MDMRTEGPTLWLVGDVDVRSTGVLRQAVYAELTAYDDVVIDLSDVTSIDLTALRVLAAATWYGGRSGRRLRLRGCSAPPVRRFLHLSGMLTALEIERVPIPA